MPAVAPAAGLPSRLGKYELLMPLAAGGMARIYIGRSTGIGSFERHVVLKMITPERANDLTAVNMFLDEARLAASLNHQNVAQVFEVGQEAGIHYLAMEYVHGQDLRAVLAKAGSQGTRIPLELALTVVAGAAAGLHHAHERRGPDGQPLGIVHRDVSPSNIMIGYDGAVKLLDFGIAKATARSVETQSGIIKGKFAYMAPEQCRGREVDRRSDVFSLGIILYEISTQHRCFRADSDFDTMHRIVTGDVVRPTRLVQGYPQALEAIVMKALAIDPAQRYQSSGLLLEALESFAVASRMSLSTMGLGRFMRDMFGEVQEPWLNTAATKVLQPIVAKESTISSTNSASGAVQIVGDTSGIPDDEAAFPDSGKAEAARTILDLPREQDHAQREDVIDDWSAKSYSASEPAVGSPQSFAPHDAPRSGYPPARSSSARMAVPSVRDSSPYGAPNLPPEMLTPTPPPGPMLSSAPSGTVPPELPLPAPRTQTPPAGQFSIAPGSGSGPAIPAVQVVSTKHGYASAAMSESEVAYPRYVAPPELVEPSAPDVQLTPNRRPLIIGMGIVLAGLVVMLVVSFGGGDDPVAPARSEQAEPQAAIAQEPPAPKPDDDVIDENMVSVIIHSEPAGADVLIAGTRIGVTPFESKLKRGTKIAPFTVQKDGYLPYAGKIDLSGEYENRNIKLVRVEDAAEPGDGVLPADKPTPDPDERGPKNTAKTATDTRTSGDKTLERVTPRTTPRPTTTKQGTGSKGEKSEKSDKIEKTEKKEEKCQPPGPNVDPFGAPICKV